MAAALADILGRVEVMIVDTANVTISEALITEAIRQALSQISVSYGAVLTLKDLDSASTTTLEERDEDLLVQGATAIAVNARAQERAEAPNISQSMPAALLEWSKNRLYWFTQALNDVRKRKLMNSATSPHSALEWDEEESEW